MIKFLSYTPVDLDITPSWWRSIPFSVPMYAMGAVVMSALALLTRTIDLVGCSTDVRVGIDGVTLRYLRPEHMTDEALQRQRIDVMGVLEAVIRSSSEQTGRDRVDPAAPPAENVEGPRA